MEVLANRSPRIRVREWYQICTFDTHLSLNYRFHVTTPFVKTAIPRRCTNCTSKASRVNTCENFQQQNFYNLIHYEVRTCKSKLGYPKKNFKVLLIVIFIKSCRWGPEKLSPKSPRFFSSHHSSVASVIFILNFIFKLLPNYRQHALEALEITQKASYLSEPVSNNK